MQEFLKKFLALFSEWLVKVKEEKMEEALEKFKEASELTEDLQKKSEEVIEKSELEKFFESDKAKEIFKSLIKKELEKFSKDLEDLKKEKENDDKTTSEALEDINNDITEVEKNLIAKIDELKRLAIPRNK